MHYLSTEEVLVIHELLLAEFGGIRGITEAGFGRLETAVSVPQQSMFGDDLYPDLTSKAGALAHAIIRNHPFSDGNKRVGVVALVEMLERNGAQLRATNDELYELAMSAARELDRDSVGAWVAQHISYGPAAVNQQTDYVGVNEVLEIRDAIAANYPDNESFEIMTHHNLLSALAAPRQSVFGSDAFPTLPEKAAALLFHLVQNHPFWDGNKRIASAAVRLFLQHNGQTLAANDADLEALTVQVASGALHQDEIAVWMSDHGVNSKT